MEATAGSSTHPYTLHAGEGETLWFVNNRAVIKARSEQTGGAFGLVEMIAAPGHSTPLHVHHAEDEPMWVLEGELTVECGGQTITAGPGSFLYTPRGVPHRFRVDGTTPARLLVLIIPGGGEGFFVEAGRPAEGEGLPEPSAPDIPHMQRVAAKYQMEFTGPPL